MESYIENINKMNMSVFQKKNFICKVIALIWPMALILLSLFATYRASRKYHSKKTYFLTQIKRDEQYLVIWTEFRYKEIGDWFIAYFYCTALQSFYLIFLFIFICLQAFDKLTLIFFLSSSEDADFWVDFSCCHSLCFYIICWVLCFFIRFELFSCYWY